MNCTRLLYGLYFVPSNGAVLSSTLHTTIFVCASSTLSYSQVPLHALPFPRPLNTICHAYPRHHVITEPAGPLPSYSPRAIHSPYSIICHSKAWSNVKVPLLGFAHSPRVILEWEILPLPSAPHAPFIGKDMQPFFAPPTLEAAVIVPGL